MIPKGPTVYLNCCLLLFGLGLHANLLAQDTESLAPSAGSVDGRGSNVEDSSATNLPAPSKQNPEDSAPQDPTVDHPNALGIPLIKNIILDQKAIWTSPAHLRWSDASWLFPLGAATGAFMATDRAFPPALTNDPKKLSRYNSISNYGVYSLVGLGGGLYLWGKVTNDDHRREAGLLAGEAAIDGVVVDSVFKYSLGRARPLDDNGLGHFFKGGASFPSEHSAVAWSIASVIAHEYPGPLTQIAVYGLATAVSMSRVAAKQHFPSDVLVGGAIGWLVGWQVYRSHHDPDLGGAETGRLLAVENGEESRDRKNMGSASVPLDHWAYAALEKLAALRYINTAIEGNKPWTRLECARLVEELGESVQQDPDANGLVSGLQTRLEAEFAYEIALLNGGRNVSAHLDSLYARAVSISGPPLTDGYHFGQTVAYDFGRPFERGTNGQAGGSFDGTAGPVAFYVRAEYQHAPSAPAISTSLAKTIAGIDIVPVSQVPASPINTINRPRLLDAYASVNLSNWQLVLGRQSLSWGPSTDSMMWNNNIEPIDMVRLVNPEPFYLPGFLHYLGPVRIDQFFGRLEGHPYVPRPFVYGQKASFKPFALLEIGIGRRTQLGGTGGDALNGRNFVRSLFGRNDPVTGSVPGDSDTELDWTFNVPGVANYIVLYGDAYAEDDVNPIQNAPRNPWHPGIFITRFPGLSRLDFHAEGVSTEQPGLVLNQGNHGIFNYWNQTYRDGNTYNGFLTGNTVGREGRAIQGWLTYWIAPTASLQVRYKNSTVNSDFIPGGGAWQDYEVRNEIYLQNGIYLRGQLQYEHISRYPILITGAKNNVTAIVEIGFQPARKRRGP